MKNPVAIAKEKTKSALGVAVVIGAAIMPVFEFLQKVLDLL